MKNEFLINQTLKGLKVTALEKWCTLRKDALSDIQNLENIYNDIDSFWSCGSEDFYKNLPFNKWTMDILQSIKDQELACIIASDLEEDEKIDIDAIYITVQDICSMDTRETPCGEIEYWFKLL